MREDTPINSVAEDAIRIGMITSVRFEEATGLVAWRTRDWFMILNKLRRQMYTPRRRI
jgi:hypothetical protein